MPNHDGTGPRSEGPMTGKNRGKCNKRQIEDQGRGMGQGRGRR